jgi:hypothetical protein
MSNSEPSAIVLHGMPCMGGIIQVSIRMEKTVRSRFAAIHPFQIAHEVSNWLGIARREPGRYERPYCLRPHRQRIIPQES